MKRTTATFLKRRGEGGMTERYEKSPAFRLGFSNGAQSIPTWCRRWDLNPHGVATNGF